MAEQARSYSLATLAVHGDDPINTTADVAPAMHVSTTYRYTDNPDELEPSSADQQDVLPQYPPPAGPYVHVYSRETSPNTSRLEMMLSQIIGAPCLTYSSGLAAFHALLTWTNPKVVAIGGGYHGCHGVLAIYQKLTKCKIVDLFDEKTWDEAGLGAGDVVHVESPINPNGIAYDITAFAEKAHKRGAILTVDGTFAPPPLQNPFKHGADYVMHSGTKYFGGHSDMLCGVIAISKQLAAGWEKAFWGMFNERVALGSVMGNMEGWLAVRSVRTLELRVTRQSQNADKIVAFLADALESSATGADADAIKATVFKLEHASLQKEDFSWLKKQMPNGFGPVFSIWLKSEELARKFPSKLRLFHHATSLGGVESLVEWRKMSDTKVDGRLVRVSVGVESWEDLRDDILDGLKALAN